MKLRHSVTAFLCALLVFGGAAQGYAAGAKSIAVLISTRGLVEIAKGDGDYQAAKFGDVLDDGDRIRTGQDGFASVVFTDDKTQIKVRPSTNITVNASREADYSLAKRVNMDVGQLFSDVQRQKGSMRVATPNSVASVKGTQFWVLVGGNGDSQVLTLQGVVQMTSLLTGQSVDVSGGGSATVGTDGAITTGSIGEGDVPGEEEPEGPTRTIEIRFKDEDGNEKTLTIEVYGEDEGETE